VGEDLRDKRELLWLSLAVASLGLIPHLVLSVIAGQAVFCESAYDEYYHWLFSVQGCERTDRWLSQALLQLCFRASGTIDFGMVLFDSIVPFILTQVVGIVARPFCSSRRQWLVSILLLLFGQELLSLGCSSIWPAPFVLSSWHERLPLSIQSMVPNYYTSFLTIFRTAEPQTSFIIFFLTFAILSHGLKNRESGPCSKISFALLTCALTTPLQYVFVALPTTIFFSVFGLFCLVTNRRLWGKLGLSFGFISSVAFVCGLLASSKGESTAFKLQFASHFPVLTPSLLLSLLLLWRSKKSADSIAKIAAIAACCVPLIVLNQQIFSGLMVSTRHWEYTSNYIFCALGALWLRLQVSNAWAGKILAAICLTLFFAQMKTAGIWYKPNVRALASCALLQKNWKGEAVLLDATPDAAVIEARTGVNYPYILDFSMAYKQPVPGMVDGEMPKSSHTARVYRTWARTGIGVPDVEAVLAKELAQKSFNWFPFLFSFNDSNSHFTDARQFKPNLIQKQFTHLIEGYENYLATTKDITPILWLTVTPPDQLPKSTDYLNQLIDELAYPRLHLYMYRQVPLTPASGDP
jgi:hypothetical protein